MDESTIDFAGDVGPSGRIVSGGVELESTPESLFPSQTDGATAVGPVAGLPAGLSVLREDRQLCIELHGLPIGANLLVTSCEIPAYESHDEVEELGQAYVSEVVIDGETARVAWGMTYLDAATVDFERGTRFQDVESHFPYWMHRFFALAAPEEATEIRLLDDSGQELGVLALEERPA